MSKKIKMGLLIASFSISLIYFFYSIYIVLTYITAPADFSVARVFITCGMLLLLLVHGAIYVHIMDSKQKVREIEDVDEWWKKWDMV